MKVERHKEYGCITLPETIDLTNAFEFKQVLQTLYEQGCSIIDVNCTHLQMIDSAGLGSLILYQKYFKERGGELRLVNVPNNYIKHLFNMIELQKVISINQ